MQDIVVVKSLEQLRKLVYECVKKMGPNCDLNFMDVSNLTDFFGVFSAPNHLFNGNISCWNISNYCCPVKL